MTRAERKKLIAKIKAMKKSKVKVGLKVEVQTVYVTHSFATEVDVVSPFSFVLKKC